MMPPMRRPLASATSIAWPPVSFWPRLVGMGAVRRGRGDRRCSGASRGRRAGPGSGWHRGHEPAHPCASQHSTAPSPIGQPVHLYTHLYLREDVVSLYGFLTPDERGLFQQLLEVSGVGPRLALAILSAMSPAAFREAIASEQPERLGAVPGIGRKLASRLILELRGKLVPSESARSAVGAPVDADVVEALMSLGYSAADAQAAVKSLPTDRPLDLEERIRLALQYFVRR